MSSKIYDPDNILSNIDHWDEAGCTNSRGDISPYFSIKFPNRKQPKYTNTCYFGHKIKQNCYIHNRFTNEIKVVGNICICKFVKKKDLPKRVCCKCRAPHKSRKHDFCKECSKIYCFQCRQPKEFPSYKYCQSCKIDNKLQNLNNYEVIKYASRRFPKIKLDHSNKCYFTGTNLKNNESFILWNFKTRELLKVCKKVADKIPNHYHTRGICKYCLIKCTGYIYCWSCYNKYVKL